MQLITSIYFTIVLHLAAAKYFIIGPAQLIFTKIVECPEYTNLPIKFMGKAHYVNKTTQVLDVNLTLPFDFDDTISIYLKAVKLVNDRKQTAYNIEETSACQCLNRYVGKLWFDIQKQIKMPPGVCPIAKGYFEAKNVYLDLDQMKAQMFFDGKFATRIIFKKAERPLLCKDFEFILEPKN